MDTAVQLAEPQLQSVTSLAAFRAQRAIKEFIASGAGEFFHVVHDDEDDVHGAGVVEVRAHSDMIIEALDGSKYVMESGDSVRFRPRIDIPISVQLQHHVAQEKMRLSS